MALSSRGGRRFTATNSSHRPANTPANAAAPDASTTPTPNASGGEEGDAVEVDVGGIAAGGEDTQQHWRPGGDGDGGTLDAMTRWGGRVR